MSPRKLKRRLLIDIRLPNEQGSRVTVRAEEPDVSEKDLDEWQAVAEQCLKLIAAHFRRDPMSVPSACMDLTHTTSTGGSNERVSKRRSARSHP